MCADPNSKKPTVASALLDAFADIHGVDSKEFAEFIGKTMEPVEMPNGERLTGETLAALYAFTLIAPKN